MRGAMVLAVMLAVGCTWDYSEEEKPDLATPAEGRRIEIGIREGAFTPARIDVQPGEWVLLMLRNEGVEPHALVVELPNVVAAMAGTIEGDGIDHLGFRAPVDAGEHVFYCPVPGHRERGEEGQVVVMPAP